MHKMDKHTKIMPATCYKLRGIPEQAQISMEADHIQIVFPAGGYNTQGYDSMASGLYLLGKDERNALRAAVAAASATVESLSGSGKPYRLMQIEHNTGADDTIALSIGGVKLPLWLQVVPEDQFDALRIAKIAASNAGAGQDYPDKDEDEDDDEDDDTED